MLSLDLSREQNLMELMIEHLEDSTKSKIKCFVSYNVMFRHL